MAAPRDRPALRPEGSRFLESAGSPSSFDLSLFEYYPILVEGAARVRRVRRFFFQARGPEMHDRAFPGGVACGERACYCNGGRTIELGCVTTSRLTSGFGGRLAEVGRYQVRHDE